MLTKKTTSARTLRKKSTPQEIKIWARLRNRKFHNLKFRRQYPLGPYIVDFICLEKKLVIEIDGWQHKKEFSGISDEKRDDFLQIKGFYVLRFWNNDVNNNIDGVFLEIEKYI